MIAADRLRELVNYRELVVNLTVRDLKLKYKGSVLGIAWSLLNPLLMMTIYTAVFSIFLRAVTVEHYWAFVLGGLLPWVFFSNSLTAATISFIRAPNLITKIYFPIESLPIAGVLANFVNFLISLCVLLVILAFVGLLGPSLILLPIILLAHLAITLGLATAIAAVTVYFRDLEHLVVIALTAWFYLTPVLYPLDPRALPAGAGKYIGYLQLNPLSWLFESYHSVLFYKTWPDGTTFTLMLVSALVSLVIGYTLFAKLRPRIPEEV
jgi:ABC-type polysaccharide/polyol phosphate export permease